MNNKALIIGVSNYSKELGVLPAVAADVQEMKSLLSSGNSRFDAASVETITDDQATLEHISKRIAELFANAKKEDTIFLYFAGHGLPSSGDYYYLPVNTAPANISGTGLSLHRLRSLFEKCDSERAVMWLDFCYSGGILARGGDETPSEDVLEIERAFKQVQGVGKVIMTACTNEQKAYELASHGRFTSVLLRGLNGEAADATGEVTVNSLHDFIDRNIGTPKQRPMFFGSMTGRIVLIRSRSVQAPTAPAPPTSTPATPAPANPVYTALIDAAVKRCRLDEWEQWTSFPLSTHPQWRREWIEDIEAFRKTIVKAVWPGTNPELESALQALSVYLLLSAQSFCRHSKAQDGGDWLVEERFYRGARGGDEYNRLAEAYDRWIDEQYELLSLATKSANLLADIIRQTIDPAFFAVEGRFAITVGPNDELQWVTRVLQFSADDRKIVAAAAFDKMKQLKQAREAGIQ